MTGVLKQVDDRTWLVGGSGKELLENLDLYTQSFTDIRLTSLPRRGYKKIQLRLAQKPGASLPIVALAGVLILIKVPVGSVVVVVDGFFFSFQ